jgi:DNA-binding MarR family transcriptional regulator
MTSEDARGDLERLDDALLRLRRLWSTPPPALVLETGDGTQVTLSSVLVVEACARIGGDVGVGDIARFLEVEHSTASRLVDRAVRAGLVTRGPSAADARRVALSLTPAGEGLRERAVGFRLAWLWRVVGTWSPAEVAALAVGLSRFADAVAQVGPPAPPPG